MGPRDDRRRIAVVNFVVYESQGYTVYDMFYLQKSCQIQLNLICV